MSQLLEQTGVLLEQARQHIAKEQAEEEQYIRSAIAEVYRIAIRDLTGKALKHDAIQLAEILQEHGWTVEKYREILDAAIKVAEYSEIIAECRVREKQAPARRQAMKDLQKRHETEMLEAQRAYRAASGATGHRRDIETLLAKLACNHPDLFTDSGDAMGYGSVPVPELVGAKSQAMRKPIAKPAVVSNAAEPADAAPAQPEPAPTPAPAKRSRHNLPSID